MNTTRCPKCNRSLIEEEFQSHECKEEVLDYKIKGHILWMFNGSGWYPQKLINSKTTRSDGFFHREDPDGDFTMPMKDGFKYHIRFLMDR
jgi:hypothetical protein